MSCSLATWLKAGKHHELDDHIWLPAWAQPGRTFIQKRTAAAACRLGCQKEAGTKLFWTQMPPALGAKDVLGMRLSTSAVQRAFQVSWCLFTCAGSGTFSGHAHLPKMQLGMSTCLCSLRSLITSICLVQPDCPNTVLFCLQVSVRRISTTGRTRSSS